MKTKTEEIIKKKQLDKFEANRSTIKRGHKGESITECNKRMKLWRAMISRVLKGHSTEREREFVRTEIVQVPLK